MDRWWSNRPLQFFAFGAALFLIAPSDPVDGPIALSAAHLSALEAAEARRLGVGALSDTQRQAVWSRAAEDELLYREALRHQLDEGDPVVKQRLIVKSLLLAEDLAGAGRPIGEADLAAHWAAHPERWAQDTRVRFIHVFSSDDRAALDAATPTLDAWHEGDPPPDVGEPFPRSRVVPLSPVGNLARDYGPELASALVDAPVGVWLPALHGKLGWHRVRILERADRAVPPLAEVRRAVERDLMRERRQVAVAAYLDAALERHTVELAGRRLTEMAWIDPARGFGAVEGE